MNQPRTPRFLTFLLLYGLFTQVFPRAQVRPEGSLGNEAPWRSRIEALLRKAGLRPKQLGYRPKSWWSAFPRMEQIPFTLPHFKDLFADPLSMPLFVRGMGEAVRRYLPPKDEGERWRKLLYFCAVDKMISGFRSYSSNLSADLDSEEPLFRALLLLLREAGLPTRLISFGKEADFPKPREELRAKIAKIPRPLRRPLARLVLHALDARRWTERALRRLDPRLRGKVHSLLNLGETQGDGNGFFPELEDAWRQIDFHSLCYGAFKAADALERARLELRAALDDPAARRVKPEGKPGPTQGTSLEDLGFRWDSPFGRILFTGTGSGSYECRSPFLVVDLGGDDRWTGRVGANAPDRSLSLFLDLGGNDRYENPDERIPSQGAGILGVGLLLDAEGDDTYKSRGPAQGIGQCGLGSLLDRSGNDRYKARYSAQGAGFLGIGLLADGAGGDRYDILAEGQGFGCLGGVGILADASGNDRYRAEPDAEKSARGDYHSQGAVSISMAQGAGGGRRGDGSDGHSYAGGLGALLDASGDDGYEAGNWSQAVGYWFGSGFLWDGGGNDRYVSCYFTQASGAHFAMAALIDEDGDDVHVLEKTGGAGLAFGWDLVNALLLDVRGDDSYEAKFISIASAEVRSNAFLLDLAGNDRYVLSRRKKILGFGRCDRRPGYEKPKLLAPYNALVDQFAILCDLGRGKDVYLLRDAEGRTERAPGAGNGIDRFDLDPKVRNHSLFRDDGPPPDPDRKE